LADELCKFVPLYRFIFYKFLRQCVKRVLVAR